VFLLSNVKAFATEH